MNRLVYPSGVALSAIWFNSYLQYPKLEKIQETLDEHSKKLNEHSVKLGEHSVKLKMLADSHENLLSRQESVEKAQLSLKQKIAEGHNKTVLQKL